MISHAQIKRLANNIRVLSIAMTEKAQSGHSGGALGGADFIATLYAKHLQFDPRNPQWIDRDRFFLDAGHLSAMLYATQYLFGMLTEDDLRNFRQLNSRTPGHPELCLQSGVENTSGPLGLGHGMACGSAIASWLSAIKRRGLHSRTFSYITDGGVQEEISQGVGRIAGHLGLSRFTLFYDSNNVQLSTKVREVSSEDTAAKYRAWGWNVLEIDGNNVAEVDAALTSAQAESRRPTIIIGRTTMASYSVDDSGNSFEGRVDTHGQPLSKAGASPNATIKVLGGDPDKPFEIFADVKEIVQKVVNKLPTTEAERRVSSRPSIPFKQYEKPISTRAVSGDILAYLAKSCDNFICMSADMCTSDYSVKFLESSSGAISQLNPLGRFLQVGVSELTMAALANGIALQGDFKPICCTYLVFSDYMKPAMRLAAMMGLPVKYIFTHDDFRVGEDGATHQPVEHELQLRLLERLKQDNFPSLLVFRPANEAETYQAWRLALESCELVPTAFILSRQAVPLAPSNTADVKYGGYVIQNTANANATLVANGSDVALAMQVAKELEPQLQCSIVSVPSIGLFRQQESEYQTAVIPPNRFTYGITSGLDLNLLELVKDPAYIFSMTTFGASAPYQRLEEKFGFTPKTVAGRILTAYQQSLGQRLR